MTRGRGARLVLAVIGLAMVAGPTVWATPAAAAEITPIQIRTIPAVPGLKVLIDGAEVVTGPDGTVPIEIKALDRLAERITVPQREISLAPGVRARFARIYGRPVALPPIEGAPPGPRLSIRLTFDLDYLVDLTYRSNEGGGPVDPSRIDAVRLKSSLGSFVDVVPGQPVWLFGTRVVPETHGLAIKKVYYTVDRASVLGASVVNRAQQKFEPSETRDVSVELLFYRVQMRTRDAFFNFPVGHHVVVEQPNGAKVRYPLVDGELILPEVPRGDYLITVDGAALKLARPVSVSRDQVVDLKVFSFVDLACLASLGIGLVAGLLVTGRRLRRRARRDASGHGDSTGTPDDTRPAPGPVDDLDAPADGKVGLPSTGLQAVARCVRLASAVVARALRRRRPGTSRRRAVRTGVMLVVAGLCLFWPSGPRAGALDSHPDPSVPVLAHYYIWFEATSWQRAKQDEPLLGRYSSDETRIMRRHIELAMASGIDGFIVSWKHTPTLDRRLAALTALAAELRFKLLVTYQALDFERNPLPVAEIAAGLDYFIGAHGSNPVYDLFGAPVVIWTGTEKYDRAELEAAIAPRRESLRVLASEKSVDGIERLAGTVAGNAYYWSSGDPVVDAGYGRKLHAMADAVQGAGGLWLAPAAPGFDARLLGGHRVVGRRDGDTLRRGLDMATRTSPDAVALISWNEFSENTHLEPSERYGDTALRTLGDIRGARAPVPLGFDSESPAGAPSRWSLVPLAGMVVLLLASVVTVGRRSTKRAAGTGRGGKRRWSRKAGSVVR